MFVPSESIYAELHDGFDDVVQKAYRARIVVVSPSILMLAIQVVQQIQKDARMREAADQIRDEVGRLVKDVGLLGERIRKLQTHFNQSNEDIRQAMISIDKIEAHGERIQQVELSTQIPVNPVSANSNAIPGPVRELEAGE
jgi:DNA recombination protein RmuC